MNTPQHRPGNDDDFAALDFGDESGNYTSADLDFGGESGNYSSASMDFGDESVDGTGEQSVVESLDADEPTEPAETGIEPSATDMLPEDIGASESTDAADYESSPEMVTVTNPPETVSVTAIMSGGVRSVGLSADAGKMTESELADEILVIADLASQKAASALHEILTEGAKTEGVDDRGMLSDLMGPHSMNLPSPAEAAETQADVFATRYTRDRGRAAGP